MHPEDVGQVQLEQEQELQVQAGSELEQQVAVQLEQVQGEAQEQEVADIFVFGCDSRILVDWLWLIVIVKVQKISVRDWFEELMNKEEKKI